METFPSKNISIAWVEKGSLTRNLFLSFGFAILTALSAQIRFELPFTPVPITAQTFVVILSGLLLGSRFGSFSMILYLFTGLAGLGLMITLNISVVEAIGIGVVPFIFGDLIKASLAIGIAQKLK